ncbi:MAG: DUF4259 domain-containing protein [Polyangiaceae bacterium]
MGAWGTKTFETDVALDWLGDLEATDDADAFLEESLTPSMADDSLEADLAQHVVCAAEVVAAILGAPSAGLHSEVVTWVEAHSDLDVEPLAEQAVHALRLVLRESELNDLWAESEKHDEWRAPVVKLRKRLKEFADLG